MCRVLPSPSSAALRALRGARRCGVLLASCAAFAGIPAHADVGAEVAVGGGVHDGDAMGALDARGDWARDGGGAAIGLGVRLRAIGDGFYRGDWDSPDDWAAIVRYAELRRADGAFEATAGAQPTITLGDGALIDGVVPAAIFDRRATGAHARARAGNASFEAIVDDVTAPTVVGARASLVTGATGTTGAADASRAGGAQLALDVAGDPLAGFGAAAVSGAATTTYRDVTDRVEAGVRCETSRAAGAWLGATTAAELGRVRFALRGEVTLGTARDVAAPFGPLYEIERVALAPASSMSASGPIAIGDAGASVRGVGGAARLSIDALAVHVEAEMRERPGLGGEYDARVSSLEYEDVQLAALIAGNPSRDWLILGGALRARIGRRAFVGVEVARQYEPVAAASAPAQGMATTDPIVRAAWQSTAWLGFTSMP